MRNYKKEATWSKQKYVWFRAKLDRTIYSDVLNRIKHIGNANWLKTAIKLFENKPKLWEENENG